MHIGVSAGREYQKYHIENQKLFKRTAMIFDPFVLPFSLGFFILFFLVIFKFSYWIKRLSPRDRYRLNKGIFSRKIFGVAGEIIMESLLHRRIFKRNLMLGYMHMSLAFGWFMLILIGNIESRIHAGTELNPPYYPIFFRFFVSGEPDIPSIELFTFLMDFFLLLVLSGVLVAMGKRIFSRAVGMKKTTRLRLFDRFAMISLWLIFPLRLMAESLTSGTDGGGGFLTGSLGNAAASIFDTAAPAYFFWWAYSCALGVFFISLPYSRYMHIPTEIFLIALRRFGMGNERRYGVYQEVEVFSCSRCGICIDVCPLATVSPQRKTQAAYFHRSVRVKQLNESDVFYCLSCGRCKEVCPVGINTDRLRLSQRALLQSAAKQAYDYLPQNGVRKTARVAYFAGCMTHLTPAVKKAMQQILDQCCNDYVFLDENASVCCGRPLLLSGRNDEAQALAAYNRKRIRECGAETLVTSCPICYKTFSENYNLGIRVMHHSSFIYEMLQQEKIAILKDDLSCVYHDPCELGRGSGIYDEPRHLLEASCNLLHTKEEKQNMSCCGGSLANLNDYTTTGREVAKQTLMMLSEPKPDCIVTACPLCKKTFASVSQIPVQDIAEIIARRIV
jgi:Fe-S oxidoreductase